jgi:hypothetical protein
VSIARCRCGKMKEFRGNRRHFQCVECRATSVRTRAATAIIVRMVIPCSCPGRSYLFPERATKEERTLMEDDALFRDWKDNGCPDDYPWEANRRRVRAEIQGHRSEA